jgi:hypothetical protein
MTARQRTFPSTLPYSQTSQRVGLASTCPSQPSASTSAPARKLTTACNNPAAIIARQKARYSRGYVPPPALCQSQLAIVTETRTQQMCSSSQPQQYTYPGVSAQTAIQSHAKPNTKKASFQQSPTVTATVAGCVPTVQPSEELLHLLLTTQKRHLSYLQQLTEMQQQLVFELQGISEGVRCMRAKLMERGTHVPPPQASAAAAAEVSHVESALAPTASSVTAASPLKRHRGQRDDTSCRGSTSKPSPREHSPHPASSPWLMTVHPVRLIGGSTTSTQALPHDEPAGEGRDSPHVNAAPPSLSRTGQKDSASDAADSEADLFLL